MPRPTARNLRILLLDVENVRRSAWPNTGAVELCRLAAAWGEREGVEVVAVLDHPLAGEAPLRVLAEPGRSADDLIAEAAERLEAAGAEVWAATSDRELRARVEPHAARLLGGGSFLRELRG